MLFNRGATGGETSLLSALLRDAERRLTDLGGLPQCRNVFEFSRALSAQRQRPLHLVPMEIRPSDPCGIWLATPAADIITYEAAASGPHQSHIIAHELGHILYGHSGATTSNDETARLLFPDLDPSLVKDLMLRSGYSNRQEREAECMATMLLEHLNRSTKTGENQPHGSVSLVLNRIRQSFG